MFGSRYRTACSRGKSSQAISEFTSTTLWVLSTAGFTFRNTEQTINLNFILFLRSLDWTYRVIVYLDWRWPLCKQIQAKMANSNHTDRCWWKGLLLLCLLCLKYNCTERRGANNIIQRNRTKQAQETEVRCSLTGKKCHRFLDLRSRNLVQEHLQC